MTKRSSRRGIAIVITAVVVALALSGCGKRGKLEAPEGEESRFTYPRFYPPPASVNPQATETRDSEDDPAGLGLTDQPPSLTPLPPSRTRTETYGTPVQ